MGGKYHSEKQKKERLNQENYNTYGTLMKIVEYKDATNIIVEFQDEYKARVHTEYKPFKKGNIKNPYDREVCGVGYLGVGEYKSKENGKQTKAYATWLSMLMRCYDPYYINKYPTYIDCFVCEEWHNFQNFAKWFYENVYNCNNERMNLDKDILIKDNKIYSPETCIFVPERINTLFIKSDSIRGEYPIGVCYCKEGKNLVVHCRILDENNKRKTKHLGRFPLNRPFQAFTCYKIFKENYIKQVAKEYRDKIPSELYEAMYRYEVEIND